MYLHNWSIGDLVIYDNWSTIHYRDAFIGKRKLKGLLGIKIGASILEIKILYLNC